MNKTCTIRSCNAGFADCDGLVSNGCEINLETDVDNWYAVCLCVCLCVSLFVCFFFAVCLRVVLTCSLCSGSCGKECALANATPVCSSGSCVIGACNAGFADCDQVAIDGCEIETDNDLLNWCAVCYCVGVCVSCFFDSDSFPLFTQRCLSQRVFLAERGVRVHKRRVRHLVVQCGLR